MNKVGAAKSSDAIIYLPGIMGSELVDARGEIVWGLKPSLIFREAVLGGVLDRLALKPDDGIHASRPLKFPVALPLICAMEPYTALEARLKTVAMHPDAVLAFAYDWRKSIADAAHRLAPTARDHLARWRQRWNAMSADDKRGLPEPRLTLVGHSMGGLVASYFAAYGDGGDEVRSIVTLGTPFGGSLNAVEALATGEALPFGAFARSLRRTVRTLPGLHELLARWDCVVEGAARRKLTTDDLADIGASRDLVDAARTTLDALDAALRGDRGQRPRVRCLVGTTQPTRQTVRFRDGVPTFFESIDDTDHRGDGTVFRYSALPSGIEPAYLPQSHGALAKTHEAVEFVAATLTERDLGDFMAPPGVGLRAPDVVRAGETFVCEILDAESGVNCRLDDAEHNRLITMAQATKQDGAVRAAFTAPQPGLYRVAVSGGGFSPVERLVAVVG